jgi:hypothetical protein
MVESPLEAAQSLDEALIEIKRNAFLFENSGDPVVLEQLLSLIRQIEIEVNITEFHIPYEAEA